MFSAFWNCVLQYAGPNGHTGNRPRHEKYQAVSLATQELCAAELSTVVHTCGGGLVGGHSEVHSSWHVRASEPCLRHSWLQLSKQESA